MTIAQCPRCGKVYSRVRTGVCFSCLPAEDEDYNKVHEAMIELHEASVEEISEVSGVGREVVMRMLEQDLISNVSSKAFECGRCGGRAISASKKLCQKCLSELDQQVVAARRALSKSIEGKGPSDTVRATIDSKRR